MRRPLFAAVAATLAFSRPAPAQADWVRDLLLAAQLPIVAMEARNDGVPNNEIALILDAVRRAGLPARDAAGILDTTRILRREYGPTDNFGAFVQSQLAAGRRGRDLAAAIRAEHARMGKGRGNEAARGGNRGNPGNSANPGNTGRGNAAAGRGRGNDSGSSNAGSRGRSGNRGKPPETGAIVTPTAAERRIHS
jgi:hypothetical protein